MTLLLTTGFDFVEVAAQSDAVSMQQLWNYSLAASGSIDFRSDITPIGRGKSCRFTDEKQSLIYDLDNVGETNLPSGIIGFHFRHNASLQSYRILAGMFIVSAGVQSYQWSVWVSENGALSVHRDLGGNQLATTDSFIIQPAGWYYVEVQYYTADSIPANTFKVRVDGVEVINLSAGTDTKAQIFQNTRYIKWQGGLSATTYIDDIYVCSLVGDYNKSFLGPCYVQTVEGTGTGSWSDFTGSDGDSVNNYLQVDEVVSDEDTTHNRHQTVIGSDGRDSYHFRHLQGSISSIFGIDITSRAKTNDAGTTSSWYNFSQFSGSQFDQSSGVLTTSYAFYSDIMETPPGDTEPWNQGNLEGAEFGVYLTTS